MAEEKEFPDRTVTLKVTKRRLTEEEKKKHVHLLTEEEPPRDCGPWYLKQINTEWYTCRICYYPGYPTGWPYEECVLLPE